MPSSKRRFKKLLKKYPDRTRVLTEGDSWFHLPIGTNIIDHLEDLSNYNIYRIEDSGDEIMQIMSGSQKIKLRKAFKNYGFDYILFSAGGNDIIGADMAELIRRPTGKDDDYFLIKDRVNKKMELIKLILGELIAIRDDYSPNTVIIVDCYDYIIPSDSRTLLLNAIPIAGPWVKPMLEGHGCHDPQRQRRVVKYLIDAFADALDELSQNNERFIFMDTRNTVAEDEWQDEIHPNSVANKRIAKMFIEKIEELEGN